MNYWFEVNPLWGMRIVPRLDLIDISLVLVDTDDEILDDMLNTKDVEK